MECSFCTPGQESLMCLKSDPFNSWFWGATSKFRLSQQTFHYIEFSMCVKSRRQPRNVCEDWKMFKHSASQVHGIIRRGSMKQKFNLAIWHSEEVVLSICHILSSDSYYVCHL